MRLKKMKKINSFEELRGLMLSLGAKEEKLEGFTFLELECGEKKSNQHRAQADEQKEKAQACK